MTNAPAPRRGRKVAEIDPLELEALIRRGATQAQAAASMGISERTLTKHLAVRPELREAIRNGKRVAVRIAGDMLLARAEAGSVTAARLIFRRAFCREEEADAARAADRHHGAPTWGWPEGYDENGVKRYRSDEG